MASELTTREMIGAGLQRVRRHLGVAQGYFAAKMRVTPGAVSQWESGAARLPLDRLPHMAAVLGIDTDLLLYEMGLTERVPDPTLEEMIARRIGRERAALWSARVEATAPADVTFGSAPTHASEDAENFPDNRRDGGPVRTVRGEVIRKDGAAGGGVIQSYPGPAVRELALASR